MEKRPHAILLKFPGTNCDLETARALEEVGFETRVCPIAVAGPDDLRGSDLVVFPGGFSYGDYVMAGRLAQLELEQRMGTALQDYHAAGGYLLGICNGFQILARLGLLPEGTLIANASGRFMCRWAGLRTESRENAFLKGVPDRFELPVAHAEGRFVCASEERAEALFEEGLVALTYEDDINGSMRRIAGLQDATGRVMGLMPHPERFMKRRQHYDPDWDGAEHGWGHAIFESIYKMVGGSLKERGDARGGTEEERS